jgi:tetratricopeptide (TPR) repeat protein
MAAVLGGGSGLWWAQKRAGAQGEARAELQEAIRLQGQEKWTEALGAIRRAKGALSGVWADPALRAQVEQRGKDLQMALLLQEARLQMAAVKDDHFDGDAASQAYADAFAWYGLAVEDLDPEEAGQRIRASSIRAHLVAALDNWAYQRPRQGSTAWRHLLAVSQEVDPAPWRERLRDVLERPTPLAKKELAASVRAGEALSTVVLLARLALGTAEAEPTVAVLRRQRQRHPDDFWANHDLAFCLAKLQPPRLEEAIRYYTAAVALRPDSPGARVNLGTAFDEQGLHDEATAEFREAIHLKPDYAAAHSGLGRALVNQEKHAEGEAAFRKAIALKPDYAEAHYNLGIALAKQGKHAEAACRKAIDLKPDYASAHSNLGNALAKQGKLAEAEAAYRKAIDLKPDDAIAHCNFGAILCDYLHRPAEAEAACRKAIELKPDDALAHCNLGIALRKQGKLAEAEAACRKAIALKPDYAEAHSNLGVLLCDDLHRPAEAEAAFRKAIALKPDYAEAHTDLGIALAGQGKLSEAEASNRKAIALKPDLANAHHGLGSALSNQGKHAEAEAAYRKAIALKPDYTLAHYDLGLVLANQGKHAEAEAAYRKAIALKPDYAEAHCNLSNVLQCQGRFADALAALKRGHELGSRRPGWPYSSAQWVRQAERFVALDLKLPQFLSGAAQPAGAGEGIALAQLCQRYKKQYAAAARFFTGAFAAQPGLASHLGAWHRYSAACAAALAGCGEGKDAADLTPMQRLRWRRQALTWLHADLRAWQRALAREPVKARAAVVRTMQHWLADTDFNGVRGAEALGRLPAEERAAWVRLWADVTDLLARAKEPMPRDKEKPNKP